MCSAPKNSYSSRGTYSDTSTELVEAPVGLTSFGHVQNFYYTSRTTCKCIKTTKEPSTKHKSKLRVIPIQIRVKQDVTRSLSEIWNGHQHRESGTIMIGIIQMTDFEEIVTGNFYIFNGFFENIKKNIFNVSCNIETQKVSCIKHISLQEKTYIQL